MSTLNIQLFYRISKRFPLIIHYLLPDLAPGLTLNGWNYPYLEQIFMVPKRFEPSRFDCMCAQRKLESAAPPHRLTSVFDVRLKTLCVLVYPQSALRSNLTCFNFNYDAAMFGLGAWLTGIKICSENGFLLLLLPDGFTLSFAKNYQLSPRTEKKRGRMKKMTG